jgi:hypothetical protein
VLSPSYHNTQESKSKDTHTHTHTHRERERERQRDREREGFKREEGFFLFGKLELIS